MESLKHRWDRVKYMFTKLTRSQSGRGRSGVRKEDLVPGGNWGQRLDSVSCSQPTRATPPLRFDNRASIISAGLASSHRNKTCTEGFSFSLMEVSAGGKSLAFRTTACAS